MTTTLHVENDVRDFDSWKAVFDKFDRFRADQNVRAYRLTRGVENPNHVSVDLDFDSVADAESFRETLLKIWATPQSKEQLVTHAAPVIRELVTEQRLSRSSA